MTLEEFNAATDGAPLRAAVAACCQAASWVEQIVAGRPYPDVAALHAVSRAATAGLDAAGLEQALAGHPRIGQRHAGGGAASAWSRHEQSAVSGAGAEVLAQLAEANAAYEQRFGQVYLVCATGRSAEQLLALCRARLAHDPVTERGTVLAELAAINDLRLDKLLAEGTT